MQITSINYLMPVSISWTDGGLEQHGLFFIDIVQDRVFAADGTALAGDLASKIVVMFQENKQVPIDIPDEVLLQIKREKTSLIGAVENVRTF
jgi:hypothetical protein